MGNAEPANTSNLPNSRLTEMAEERARRIRDHHGVALSHADMASASLLSLLRKANSPLDLYDKITGWSKEWVNSDETLPSRADFMKRQGERYNLDGLYPKNIPVFLAGRKETVNVVVHDFASCLFSLLSNPALMQKEYLLFDPDNPSGWCGPEEPKDITHDDDQSSKDNDEDGSHLDSSESSEENDNDTDGQEQETNTDYQESVSGASNPDDQSKPDDSDKNSESDQSESSPWIGDINTSAMFRKGLETYCPLSDDFLCPLIFFIDGTPIDVHGNLSMEPVQMTLGIFNQAARARPEFWVTIGYVNNPNTKRSSYEVGFEAAKARLNSKERAKKKSTKSDSDSEPEPDESQPQRVDDDVSGSMFDYHHQLGYIFSELQKIQTQGGLHWRWSYSSPQYKVTQLCLKLPILFIIGDTVGHDKLCGLKAGGKSVYCRVCSCVQEEMDDPLFKPKYTHMSTLKKMATTFHGRKKIASMGYHPLKKNAFYDLLFCDPESGINGCTPVEILHHLQQGLFKYLLNQLCDLKVS